MRKSCQRPSNVSQLLPLETTQRPEVQSTVSSCSETCSLYILNTLKASLQHVNLLCQITLLPSALSFYTPVLVGLRERNHHSVCLAKLTKCPDCVSQKVNPLTVNPQCCHRTCNHPLPAFSLKRSLRDLLPGFSLLLCLFVCFTFHTDVCTCKNEQMISFSWSNGSCRLFPRPSAELLTHTRCLKASTGTAC